MAARQTGWGKLGSDLVFPIWKTVSLVPKENRNSTRFSPET